MSNYPCSVVGNFYPYWPILACGMRVQVKTTYFEKFKIISTHHIQMKLST
jgi:hypothetical protein